VKTETRRKRSGRRRAQPNAHTSGKIQNSKSRARTLPPKRRLNGKAKVIFLFFDIFFQDALKKSQNQNNVRD
jgi:hypothetical protein